MELFKIYYSNGMTTVVECDYFSESEDIALIDALEIVKIEKINQSEKEDVKELSIPIIKADSYNNGYLDGCKMMGKLRETHIHFDKAIKAIYEFRNTNRGDSALLDLIEQIKSLLILNNQ